MGAGENEKEKNPKTRGYTVRRTGEGGLRTTWTNDYGQRIMPIGYFQLHETALSVQRVLRMYTTTCLLRFYNLMICKIQCSQFRYIAYIL